MPGKPTLKSFIHYLPVYGCISTGIIYLAIGVIAILSFLKIKDGGADESSLLAFLHDFVVGRIFIWIIMLGTLSYICWRIFEAIKDPYEYGKEAKGLAIRTGIALSTIADALIVFSAVQVLLGKGNIQEDGQPEEQREMVSDMLQQSWGEWVVIGIGAVVCITAVVQFRYGVTRGYRERLDIAHFSTATKSLIHLLAWVGYLGRGIILGIIGFFFVKAGITLEAQHVVNTDKAFDFIGDHVGHVWFIAVAAATICYGLFMFALGGTYDPDKG